MAALKKMAAAAREQPRTKNKFWFLVRGTADLLMRNSHLRVTHNRQNEARRELPGAFIHIEF